MTYLFQSPLPRRAAWAWIVLATIAAHFLLPICTLVVSDDWFTLLAYKQHSLEAAWNGAVYLNMPLTVVQTLPFFLIGPNLFVLRSINLLVLMAQGITLYNLIVLLRPRAQTDALWIAIIAVTFPGYMTHFMVSFLFYPLGFLLFIFSLQLTLQAEATKAPRPRFWLMTAALAVAFYSFHLGALLVFYGLYILAHLYFIWSLTRPPLLQLALGYLRTRYVYLVLPFWFWGFRQFFALLEPTWAEYNQPSLSLPAIKEGLLGFGVSYLQILEALWHDPLLGWTALAFLVIYLFRRPSERREKSGLQDYVGALVGGTALLGGILPFVLVGKYPYTSPISVETDSAFVLANHQILKVIDTRMHLFLGLAAGLLLVHLGRIACHLLRCPSLIYYGALGSITAASISVTVSNYVYLQKKGMLMEGVRESMKAKKELAQYGIIGVVDNIGNISTTWDSWVLFLETVWGDRSHHGIPERWVGAQANADLYFRPTTVINTLLYGGAWHRFFQEPTSAKEASIIMSEARGAFASSDTQTLARYYFNRSFNHDAYVAEVSTLVRITVLPKTEVRTIVDSSANEGAWKPLRRLFPADGGSGFPANDGPNGSFARGPAVATEFQITRPLDGAGRLLLVSGDRPLHPDLLSNLNLVDSRQRVLPTICVGGPHGVQVLGVSFLDSASIHVEAEQEPRAPILLHHPRGLQQASAGTGGFSILPQPYLDPVEIYPETFASSYDIQDVLFEALLINPADHKPRPGIIPNGSRFNLQGNGSGAFLDTGAAFVTPGRNTYVRIDWGGPSSEAFTRIAAVDNREARLMDLLPPVDGGVRYYEVPKPSTTTAVYVRLFAGDHSASLLPARISIVDVDKNLIITRPFDQLFPN